MINRSLTIAATLLLGAFAFGPTTASAQQFRSSCPLGAEQFGGRCNHGYYTPPRQQGYVRMPPRVIRFAQPQEGYVVVRQQPSGNEGAVIMAGILGLAITAIMNH